MSRAFAAVRFPDGTVRWCLYNGTSDILVPLLHDHPEEPWESYYAEREGRPAVDLFPEPDGEPEPVLIYSDYGGGWWWEGTATRNTVVGPLDPWEDGVERHYGRGDPDWVSPAYQAMRRGRD